MGLGWAGLDGVEMGFGQGWESQLGMGLVRGWDGVGLRLGLGIELTIELRL